MDRARQRANTGQFVVEIRLNPILLFGGTFDPVHNAHTAMAAAALAETGAAKLTILAAGNPYQRGRLPFASAPHRLAMLKIAFADCLNVSIDARELERQGPTYTVDTLRELHGVHGAGAPLIWLIGGDAFARLDTWHEWQSLFTLTNFAVALRQGEPHPMQVASAALSAQLDGKKAHAIALGASQYGGYAILAAEVPAISSTEIRARLMLSQSIRGIAPDGVCDYIEQHSLYSHEEKT